MKILYVLPHPDDESFGPAPVIAKYIREGHEIHLLTLTRGGATKQRFKLGLSVTEMGKVRFNEMLNVQKVLHLTSMTVLDLPDSALKEMDPREIEAIVYKHVQEIKPDVLITYPVHGVSGFYDHLVCHAIVKRVFVEIKEKFDYLKRLAFFGLMEKNIPQKKYFSLKPFLENEIDCIIEVEQSDIDLSKKALDCYVSYKETIEKSGIKNILNKSNPFEFFGESITPAASSLFENLKD